MWLSAGLALLLVSNLLIRYRLSLTPGIAVRAYDGLIGLGVDGGSPQGSFPSSVGVYWEREPRPHIKLDFKVLRFPTGWAAIMPTSLPLALSTAATGLLWRRERIERRRAMKGHCSTCGYDLQGLAAANCPECGAAASQVGPKPGVA